VFAVGVTTKRDLVGRSTAVVSEVARKIPKGPY
jgi:hypothetical protein